MTIWNSIARFVARPTIANWLIQRSLKTPYTHLPRTDDPSYMARYWVFNPYDRVTNKPKYWFCPWSIRVHHIKRDDYERDMHDHPWNARTIILKGHYFEKRLEPATALDLLRDEKILWDDKGEPCVEALHWRRPGDTAKLAFQQYHTVVDVSEGGVWTLFISGPWRGVWGFLVDAVKIPWKTYLNVPENGDLDDPKPAAENEQQIFCGLPDGEEPQLLPPGERVIEHKPFSTGVIIERDRYNKLAPSHSEIWGNCRGEMRPGQAYADLAAEFAQRQYQPAPVPINLHSWQGMSPLEAITEWRKGCSCATEGQPYDCVECTMSMIRCIEKWHLSAADKVRRLVEQDAGQNYSETEHFVADAALQMGFEIMDDDATIYACNLRQLVTLLRGYGVKLKGDEQ